MRFGVKEEGPSGLPEFEWGEFVVDELRPKFKEPIARDKAASYIKEMLKDGPRTAREIIDGARARHINDRTLDRAKRGLAGSFQTNQEWRWYLLTRATEDGPVVEASPQPVVPAAPVHPEDIATKALAQARARLISIKRRGASDVAA